MHFVYFKIAHSNQGLSVWLPPTDGNNQLTRSTRDQQTAPVGLDFEVGLSISVLLMLRHGNLLLFPVF